MKPGGSQFWLLLLALLLLIVAGQGWRNRRRSGPAHTQVLNTKALVPPKDAPVLTLDRRESTMTRAVEKPPSATPFADHYAEWLSVSPVQRKSWMSPEAMEPYEAILASLHLTPDRLLRLRELIVEREESAQTAESLAKDENVNAENTALLHREAEALFDRELAEIAGDSNLQKVQQMLSLEPQLAQIVQTLGRDLVLLGAPLNADQLLALAQIYKDAYAPSSRGLFNRTAGFDLETGLATADRQVLTQAAAILGPKQLDLLEADLARTTTAYAEAER